MYEAHPKFVRESVDKERDVAYNKNTDTNVVHDVDRFERPPIVGLN